MAVSLYVEATEILLHLSLWLLFIQMFMCVCVCELKLVLICLNTLHAEVKTLILLLIYAELYDFK